MTSNIRRNRERVSITGASMKAPLITEARGEEEEEEEEER
jgi:hypothetical protein